MNTDDRRFVNNTLRLTVEDLRFLRDTLEKAYRTLKEDDVRFEDKIHTRSDCAIAAARLRGWMDFLRVDVKVIDLDQAA